MASAAAAVPICVRCGEASAATDLVNLAVRGELVAVCQRCFLVEQIGDLIAGLPAGYPCRGVIEDGLRTVYEVVVGRSQELALAGHLDAASARL